MRGRRGSFAQKRDTVQTEVGAATFRFIRTCAEFDTYRRVRAVRRDFIRHARRRTVSSSSRRNARRIRTRAGPTRERHLGTSAAAVHSRTREVGGRRRPRRRPPVESSAVYPHTRWDNGYVGSLNQRVSGSSARARHVPSHLLPYWTTAGSSARAGRTPPWSD
jgi:hypothetical protein